MRIDDPKIGQKPLKLERVHRTILKEAEKNGGVYNLLAFRNNIKKKHPDDIKMQKQLLQWNQTTIRKMVMTGILTQTSPLEYRVTNVAAEAMIEKELSLGKHWQPGKNHINLLKKNKNGIIRSLDLKEDCKDKRQKKITDGMLHKLSDHGYLERTERGVYHLTEAAFEQLKEEHTAAKPLQKKAQQKESTLKITAFDRLLKEIVNEKGEIDNELLKKHPRGDSLQKRIETLKKTNLIIENKPSMELLQQIDKVAQWKKQKERQKELRIGDLTPKQKQIMDDMRIFQNLTYKQMEKYIYMGESIDARTDIDFLIKNKILKKDPDLNVYVFEKQGAILSNRILEMEGKGDMVKYSSKLFSRKEEIEHDVLVYTAYQELLIKLKQKSCTILSIKNDRQLRREDALQYGHMQYGYPDLRIEYKEPGSLFPIIHDLEIDCGYDKKTIKNKIEKTNSGNRAIPKLHQSRFTWVCSTIKQAAKVAKSIQDKSKAAPRQRPDIYVIDQYGRMIAIKDL